MSDTTKQERIEEYLRKSLLGDELINTQFHLFSAKSVPSSRVTKPRVLCVNNALLAKSSKYFLDLLSSDINPSDTESLIDITSDNDIPRDVRIDDYSYGSDSDLDDDEDFHLETEKDQSTTTGLFQPTKQTKEDDEVSEDGSESATSDMFVLSPEAPRPDGAFGTRKQGNESFASSETAAEEMRGNTVSDKHASVRLRSLGSRHILVKDIAFQTWYTLLNYLYTGKVNFLPLSSARIGSHSNPSSTSSLDEPRCSAKSMYRLASKVGLDELRDEAFSYIRSNFTEHNILQELSCSLMSRYPSLLEMELNVLYSHIASPPVVAGFPALARRIANGELAHGADIVIGIHTRLLKEPKPSMAEPSLPRSWFAANPSVSNPLSEEELSSPEPAVSSFSVPAVSSVSVPAVSSVSVPAVSSVSVPAVSSVSVPAFPLNPPAATFVTSSDAEENAPQPTTFINIWGSMPLKAPSQSSQPLPQPQPKPTRAPPGEKSKDPAKPSHKKL